MIKVITKLIIASAGLWLALPAAAQFELDPDHFDDPATNVVQPRPEQSKGAMRISLPYKQVQRHHVQTFKGRKGPANAQRTLSSAAGVQPRGVSGASGVAREPADRKASEQSRLAPAHRPYDWAPQLRYACLGQARRNAFARFVGTLCLMLMRDIQGNGVFAISSACHRRRRIAASRWTLRVVCVGELRECGAPTRSSSLFGTLLSDVSGRGLSLKWRRWL